MKHQVNIWVPYDDLKAQFNSRHLGFHNTLFDIVVDGMAYRVLPRYLSIHPSTYLTIILMVLPSQSLNSLQPSQRLCLVTG